MVEHSIAIEYTNRVIGVFDDQNIFKVDMFLDREKLKSKVLKKSVENLIQFKDPTLTDVDLDTLIKEVKFEAVDEALDALVSKDIVQVSGMDSNGNLLYSLKK